MNNTNETNKLVSQNKKRRSSPRVSVDAKIREKFYKKVKKHNKGLAKEKQLSITAAASQALKMWMEKTSSTV